MLPVIFSDRGYETFILIREQIYNRWGNNVAAEFEDKTSTIVALIEIDPYLFQAFKNDPTIRKGFIHKNCSVFYEIKDERIEILFFWDNRQEPFL